MLAGKSARPNRQESQASSKGGEPTVRAKGGAPAATDQAIFPEEAFPIPEGAWQRWRVPGSSAVEFDAVLDAAFAAAAEDESLTEFVAANRDLLDYRWLYRLTGELLRDKNEGNEARSLELRGLRDRIVKLSQRFDAPLFKQIAEAEGRLGQVLGRYQMKKPPAASEIVKAAGESTIQIFAFWVVLCAAIAAWESKVAVPGVLDLAKAKLKELDEVLVALAGPAGLMEQADLVHMNAMVALPNQMLPASDPAAARGALQATGLTEEEQQQLIRKLGCLYCQASRHAFQAYNPFVQKTAALHDVLLFGRQVSTGSACLQL